MKKNVIPNRLEKYMAFFLNKNLVFLDSMQFMNSSLKELVKNLSDNDFKYSTEEWSSVKDGTTDDNGEKLDGHISDEHYLTRNKIWNEFSMKNMGYYHDHCLKKDVLLLAYVFQKFTGMCLKFYGLDPCHYFSSPGLSWDSMLKMTEMRLE